jgi:hypothetical protein
MPPTRDLGSSSEASYSTTLDQAIATAPCATLKSRLTVGPSCVHYWDRFVPQALYRAVSTGTAIRSDLDEQWVPLVSITGIVACR